MPPLPALSDAEIALIQSFLDGLCPPGTGGGAELYGANCAYCHGADANGASGAPSVRCATRVADAVEQGRGAAMPAFPQLATADVSAVTAYLDLLCTTYGRTGDELYAGNCATCHGATAHGGRNALGVSGPGIACASSGDYAETVRSGDDRMPAFPALTDTDVSAIVAYVRGQFCAEP
jgi:mono/diheme cytochrome c family protein